MFITLYIAAILQTKESKNFPTREYPVAARIETIIKVNLPQRKKGKNKWKN